MAKAARGETYQVTGTNEAGDWYQITFEGDPGWLTADLVSVNGTVDGLAMIEVEPPAVAVAAAAAPAAAAQPAAAAPKPAAQPASSYPPAGGYFGYGMQSQVYGGADLGFINSTSQSMGFNWTKYQVPWKDFEGSKGAYGWAAWTPSWTPCRAVG